MISEINKKNVERLKKADLTKYENLELLFQVARNIQSIDGDFKEYLEVCKFVKGKSIEFIPQDIRFYGLYNQCLLFEAPHLFDSFLLYMEKDRDIKKCFYMPRRKILKLVVNDLQDLEDGVIDFLGVSLPTRTGKSTLCIFFIAWIMGRNPDMANLMSGHSDKLTKGFYKEALNFITNQEYNYVDIFPSVKLESQSADDEAINLNSKTRFPSLTCRSIDGTLTGAVEAANYLYCDDLVRDRTESLNPVRLENKYQDYLNVLVDRKKDGAKELMVGTRWNVLDPLGKIEKDNKNNLRYRFRKIPALNKNGESNFQYDYGVGFSTEYFQNIKKKLDKNEWEAKYQQRPFLREGLLFPEDELKTYHGVLPSGVIKRKVFVTDVAWGGGDSLSTPICYEYENGDKYIVDWVFNKGDKTVTKPIIVGKTLLHEPHQEHFEANNGGDEYADDIDRQLKEKGFRTSVTHSKAPSNMSKLARIIQFAPEIKNLYFLSEEYRSQEYQNAIDELTMFVQIGKNEHDDAPDSLAQLIAFLNGGYTAKCEAMQRPC